MTMGMVTIVILKTIDHKEVSTKVVMYIVTKDPLTPIVSSFLVFFFCSEFLCTEEEELACLSWNEQQLYCVLFFLLKSKEILC